VIDGGNRNLTPDSWVVELNCSQDIGITIRGVTITHGGEIHAGGNLVNKGCRLSLKDSAVINSAGLGIEHSGGRLSVQDSVISGSDGGVGGGIVLAAGTGSLIHSAVFRNSSKGDGAGILIEKGGTLRVHRSTISNNGAFGGGGGISNNGKLEVIGSNIINNTNCQFECGIQNKGVATITDSLIADNEAAAGDGGGIGNSGKLTLIRSTVRNNRAPFCDEPICGPPRGGHGGGIFNGEKARLILRGSLITENFAGVDGGGVFNDGGTVLQTKTFIINNTPNDCAGC
jgi:hypothetical protein